MDFSDALKALKEGKKVRQKNSEYDFLKLVENVERESGYSLNLFKGSKMIDNYPVLNDDLLATDWEIVKPQKVPVKTKNIEYVTCSNCGKDLECTEDHQHYRLCGFCGNEMQVERPMTVEEAIEKFNGMHFNPKTKFGELSQLPIIKLPSLNVNKGVQEGTIKVVNVDPFQTILEFMYSP